MKTEKVVALARVAWFIENLSQGSDSIAYGTTKKEALAEHRANYPSTVTDNLKASLLAKPAK